MAGCITNKKIYLTQEMAEEALIGARIRYDFAPGTGPVTFYKCEHCGGYHLTSQGEMNEKLAAYMKEGKIDLHKEADRWLDKLRKRR